MDTHPTDAHSIADLPDETPLSEAASRPTAGAEHGPGPVGGQEAADLAPHADDRLVAPDTRPRRSRKHPLLARVAAVAIGGIGIAGFLVSPWNHLYPVPRMAASARHLAAAAGLRLPAPVSPASELARAAAPQAVPAPTLIRPKPVSRQSELAEVLSFKRNVEPAAVGSAQHADERSSGSPLHSAEQHGAHAQVAASRTASPPASASPPTPAVIPGEVGMPPMVVGHPGPQTAVQGHGEQSAALAPPGGPAKPATAPATPEHVAGPMVTAVTAALAPEKPQVARGAGASSPDHSAAPTQHPDTQAALPANVAGNKPHPVAAKTDPATQATHLVAAPLATPDQIKVVNMVAEVAAMVRDLKIQQAELRSDLQKSSGQTGAELADLQRRVSLIEADRALDAARNAGLPTAPSAAAQHPDTTPPVRLTRADATLPDHGSDAGERVRYHVQAASNGLAMLAEVDRSGGDGADLQVNVGDSIPGYGKVKSIGQVGARWVITTEHGTISN